MSVWSLKRKKTAPLKSFQVMASVPNPNSASNVFNQQLCRHLSGPKASLPAVPIGTKSSGRVSASQPKESNTTQLFVTTGEVSSIGVPSLDNQTNAVQIVGGGRKNLSIVPYRKQLKLV